MVNELYHHGILGQKWGVRRFQNKDGTLTEAGKHQRNKKFGYQNISVSKSVYANRPKTTAVRSRTNEDNRLINEIQTWDDNERKHILRGK